MTIVTQNIIAPTPYFSRACTIELGDTVVMTGGMVGNGTEAVYIPGSRVQVYNIDGDGERLPDINTARLSHACGHYIKDDKVVILIKRR